jgi:hypothetical protein
MQAGRTFPYHPSTPRFHNRTGKWTTHLFTAKSTTRRIRIPWIPLQTDKGESEQSY